MRVGWAQGFARLHHPGINWAASPAAGRMTLKPSWELLMLSAEWERVYGDPDNRDLQGALMWHDKWFPGVLARLAGSIKCDQGGCRIRCRRVSTS